ncbi:MAG: SpoIIE family protein phosphatase [Chlorobiaceae bacterium]|nr:SpoIIE family protein phosphatase [Chlorobiaceae bacterium]
MTVRYRNIAAHGILPRTLRERFTVIALICSGVVFLLAAPVIVWLGHLAIIDREEDELRTRLEASFVKASSDMYEVRQELLSLTDLVQMWKPAGSQSWYDIMEGALDRMPSASGVRLAFEQGSKFNPDKKRAYYVRSDGDGKVAREKLRYLPEELEGPGLHWYLPAREVGVSSTVGNWSSPYTSPETGRRQVVSCILPINRVEAGKASLDGVAAVDVSIDTFLRRMAAVDINADCRLYVLDSGHHVLASASVGNAEGVAPAGSLHALVDSKPVPARRYPGLSNSSLETGSFEAEDPFGKGHSFFVYKRVPGLSLIFLYVFPLSQFATEQWLFAGGVLLAGLLCIVGIGLLFSWSAGRATRNLDLLREGVRSVQDGNFTTIQKLSATHDETADVIDAFNGMVGELNRSILKREEMARSQQRLSTELALAHTIQASVLPEPMKLLGGCHFSLSVPALEVGGDFYDHFVLPGGLTVFTVGDISGKGVSAAMFMMQVSLLLRSLASVVGPGEAITRINTMLAESNPTMMFVTLFHAVMDPVGQTLSYVNAGHNPPVLVRADGTVESLSKRSGPALGVITGQQFPVWQVPFNEGDLLAIYTDGISEAMDPSGEQFGMERMNGFLSLNRLRPVDQSSLDLLEAVQAWQVGDERFDDITLTLVRAGHPARQLCLPASMATIGEVVAMVESTAIEGGMGTAAAREISLAACEAVTNVISYSLHEDEALSYRVFVSWSDDDLVVRIEDPGPPFNPSELSPVDVTLPLEDRQAGGLGWFIIGNSTDEYHLYRVSDINVLVMVRSRTRPTMGHKLKTKED